MSFKRSGNVYNVIVCFDGSILRETIDGYHRDEREGPAIEWFDGSRMWYRNGCLHREDGPAIEYLENHMSWYLNGKLHREDGPAIERYDGSIEWYFEGRRFSEEEFPGNICYRRFYD